MLTLEPLATDPWGAIVTALANKIKDTNLSLHKYLTAQGHPTLKVFTQMAPAPGEKNNQWDPPLSACPAVVLMSSAFPFADDRGVGDERWYFAVTVMFKMRLTGGDATPGFQACHELIRTIWAGNRTGSLDPLQAVAGGAVGGYSVEGNLTPEISTEASGRSVARVAFDIRFRLNQRIFG